MTTESSASTFSALDASEAKTVEALPSVEPVSKPSEQPSPVGTSGEHDDGKASLSGRCSPKTTSENDAPVRALLARLHAGTTLADRVRRMRGRREGTRLRRLTKARPIE